MDSLFLYESKDLKDVFMSIEDEMMEEYDEEFDDESEFEAVADTAYEVICTLFLHFKRFYKESKRTVFNLIEEIYRIAATGEYTHLQAFDDIRKKEDLFELIKGKKGFDVTIFAIRMLRYYYIIREKEHHSELEWRRLEKLYSEACRLLVLGVVKKEDDSEKKQEKTVELSEKDFLVNLYSHMNKYYVGQDNLKKNICAIISQWLYHDVRTVTLIIGPSGCGKNHMIETIKSFEYLTCPVVYYDCTALTPAGFKGDDVTDIYKRLIEAKSKFMSEKKKDCSKMILFLDEADKIINWNHDANGESVNSMAQQTLLTLLAGTEKVAGIDTHNLLIILAGAFPRIDELRKERDRNTIGFTSSETSHFDADSSLREDILTIGGEKEFVGRIQNIIQLKRLTKSDLKAILMDENIGVFVKKRKTFESAGLSLDIDDDMADAIVDCASKEDAGARSITNKMNEYADAGCYFDMKYMGVNAMRIHRGMLDGEKPIFSKKSMKEGRAV